MVMETSRHWRLRQERYALVGEVCPHCTTKIFPPRDVCPECGKDARDHFHFSGRGEIYSHTTVFQAPEEHAADAPYPVAIVQLEEGPLVTAQLTDVAEEAVEIGMPVEMVTRRIGEDGDRGMLVYGYKFRPRLTSI